MKASKRMEEGVLVLEDAKHPDGIEFRGTLFGAPLGSGAGEPAGNTKDRGYGEVVFNTSMTGYQEILTDPSYYGQIVCMTTPHIGNTGVNFEDPESSQPWCAGFVVHEFSESPSNWRSKGNLADYLEANGIPGLYGVDTRALTRQLRTTGVVRGILLPMAERGRARELFAKLPPFEGRDLISEVTTKKPYLFEPTAADKSKAPAQRFKVVTMDFGVKLNLLRSLHHYGCDIEVVPASATSEEILAKKPDGIFLSNGPGDPAAAPYAAKAVRQLVGKVPLFGVCMGHQILALAIGAKTYKLKFGHRGGNQPVIDHDTKRVEISSHNHGYAVSAESLPAEAEVTHLNLNDKTVEGLRVKGADAFSVQYHPEACPGPHDSMILFERFIKSMQARKQESKGR